MMPFLVLLFHECVRLISCSPMFLNTTLAVSTASSFGRAQRNLLKDGARHLLPVLGKSLVVIVFTFFVNCSHSSSLHLITHHPASSSSPSRQACAYAVSAAQGIVNQKWPSLPQLNTSSSSTCFALSHPWHSGPLRGWNPCWMGEDLARTSIGLSCVSQCRTSPPPTNRLQKQFGILAFSVNGDCHVLPVL